MTIINQLTSFKLSGITYTGTSQQLNYTAGVTAGSVVANKGLVVDSNRDLIGSDNTTRVRNLTLSGALTAVTINGILQSNNQPNITSLGNLTNLNVVNNLTITNHNGIDTGLILSGTLVSANAHQLNYNMVTPGTASGNKSLVVDSSRVIGNIHTLTSQHIYTDEFYIDSVVITASADEINYLDIISPGNGQASKALVLDSGRNINNINSLTASILNVTSLNVANLSGTITTSNQPNITSLGTLTSLILSGTISGVTTLSTTNLTLNGTSITSTGTELNILSGAIVSSTELNYLSGITLGTAGINKVLTTDGSRNLSNLNTLSLIGNSDVISMTNTIANSRISLKFINDARSWEFGSRGSAADQPNSFYLHDNTSGAYRLIINSFGSLNIVAHNGSTAGLQLGGALVTSTAAELNILDGVTASAAELNFLDITTIGSGQASKALILDSNLNINNINILSSNGLNTNTSSTNILTNSSFTDQYELYLRRPITAIGSTAGIAFHVTTNSVSTSAPGASITYIRTASVWGHLTFNTAQNERLRILDGGNVGIGTINPNKRLEINSASGDCLRLTYNDSDGSATMFADFNVSSTGQLTISPSSNNANTASGDILLKGSVIIGKDANNNILRFNGTTGDATSNMTVIAERIYSGIEASELLLFKGNDIPGGSGPDRIRYRSAEHVFQTFTAVEEYSTLGDNNTRLFISNNGNIGISTSVPLARMELYQSTGSAFLRLTNSTTAGYGDLNIYADGTLQLKSSNTSVHIGDNNSNTMATLLIGTSNTTTGTTGSLRITNSNGVNYIQSGTQFATGSSADLVIGDMIQAISASSRKIIFKANGKVGFGTSNPDKALEINSSTGECLRLTYNDSDGSASTFCDISVNSNGLVSFNSNGIASGYSFSGGNITGTLQTSSQPNITSIGTLIGLTLSGAITGITNLTMSGTLSGASSISATNITGLLTTATQSNITALGRLNTLSIANNLKLGDNSAADDFIHIEQNTNAFIGIQIENRNSNAETSGCKLSFMGYRDTNFSYEVCRIASVTTTSDAPTFYQYGALAFSTRNGYLDATLTERMRITNTGNIGINISNPTERLHVSGNILSTGTITNSSNIISSGSISATNGFTTTSGRISLGATDLGLSHFSLSGSTKSELVTYSNGTITGIGSYNAFPFCLYTNDTERLRVTNSGNIGIRTTNPQGFLDFGTNSTDYTILLYQNGSQAYGFGAATSALKYLSAGSNGHIWYTSSTLSSTGTERMRLDGSGFLGIGTSSPSSICTIQRTLNNPYIRWTDGTTIAETFINSSGVPSMGSNTNHGLGFYTNNGSSSQLYLEPSVSKNVGIGTNTPTYKLDVAGTGRYSGTINEMLVLTSNSTESMIALNATGTSGRKYWIGSSATGSNITAGSFFILDTVASSFRLAINSNGNVGIGTNNPGYKLDVSGTIDCTNLLVGTSTDTARLISALDSSMTAGSGRFITLGRSNDTGNQAEIAFVYQGSNSATNSLRLGFHGSERLVITNEGRVGINTTSPADALDVNGAIRCTNNVTTTTGRFRMSAANWGLSHNNNTCEIVTYNSGGSGGYGAIGTYTYNNCELWAGNAMRILLEPGGNVKRFGTSTSFDSSSDMRLKENIINADLDLCYNNIKNLRLVHYKWKDNFITPKDSSDRHKLGWIAQEVETIFPNSVTKSEEFGIKDCRSINVDQIYTTLYGCTKKLIEDKENLENENIKLNNKINEMEEVVTDLYEQVNNLNDTVEELKNIVNSLINK